MTDYEGQGAEQRSGPWVWIVAAVLIATMLGCAVVVVVGLLLAFFMGVPQQVSVPPQLATVRVETRTPPVEPTAVAGELTVEPPQGDPYEGLEQTISDDAGAVGFSIGDPFAPVTVVEYSDFSCPHCHDLAPAIKQIIAEYGSTGEVRVVYKPIVFVNPSTSVPAGQASYCAAEQGMFWQMHDAIWSLYQDRGASAYTQETLTEAAAALGIDEAAFTACFNSEESASALDAVLEEALQLGVQGTPTIFVNGEDLPYTGPDAIYGDLAEAIEAVLDADPLDG